MASGLSVNAKNLSTTLFVEDLLFFFCSFVSVQLSISLHKESPQDPTTNAVVGHSKMVPYLTPLSLSKVS